MSGLKQIVAVVVVAALCAAWLSPAAAQQDGQGRRGQFGQGQGNFDPAQFQAQMMERMKMQLGATDEEWGVIEPRLTKVMEVQRQGGPRGGLGFGFGGGGRGQGGPGGGRRGGGAFGQAEDSPVAQKTAALMTVLENQEASNGDIEKALDELRKAREEHEKQLATAREDLRAVLTLRQEATLVGMAMLD